MISKGLNKSAVSAAQRARGAAGKVGWAARRERQRSARRQVPCSAQRRQNGRRNQQRGAPKIDRQRPRKAGSHRALEAPLLRAR